MMSVMFGVVYGLVLMAASLELRANVGLGAIAVAVHRRLADRQPSSPRQPV